MGGPELAVPMSWFVVRVQVGDCGVITVTELPNVQVTMLGDTAGFVGIDGEVGGLFVGIAEFEFENERDTELLAPALDEAESVCHGIFPDEESDTEVLLLRVVLVVRK